MERSGCLPVRMKGRDHNYFSSKDREEMTMNDDILILCPYCMSLVSQYSGFCPTCLEDITNDAKYEMTRKEYTDELRKACQYCGAEMLFLASKCPTCRKWQSGTRG